MTIYIHAALTVSIIIRPMPDIAPVRLKSLLTRIVSIAHYKDPLMPLPVSMPVPAEIWMPTDISAVKKRRTSFM
jgi:hypothetical protein